LLECNLAHEQGIENGALIFKCHNSRADPSTTLSLSPLAFFHQQVELGFDGH